jgi:hypothetical protein
MKAICNQNLTLGYLNEMNFPQYIAHFYSHVPQ